MSHATKFSLLSLVSELDPESQKYRINVDYDEDITSLFCSVMNSVALREDAIFAYAKALKNVLSIGLSN